MDNSADYWKNMGFLWSKTPHTSTPSFDLSSLPYQWPNQALPFPYFQDPSSMSLLPAASTYPIPKISPKIEENTAILTDLDEKKLVVVENTDPNASLTSLGLSDQNTSTNSGATSPMEYGQKQVADEPDNGSSVKIEVNYCNFLKT